MLHNGQQVGDGSAPEVDIAVDPLEGTRLCAFGMPNAVQRAGWRFQEGRALAAAAAVESRVGVFTPRDPVAEAS